MLCDSAEEDDAVAKGTSQLAAARQDSASELGAATRQQRTQLRQQPQQHPQQYLQQQQQQQQQPQLQRMNSKPDGAHQSAHAQVCTQYAQRGQHRGHQAQQEFMLPQQQPSEAYHTQAISSDTRHRAVCEPGTAKSTGAGFMCGDAVAAESRHFKHAQDRAAGLALQLVQKAGHAAADCEIQSVPGSIAGQGPQHAQHGAVPTASLLKCT